MAFSSYYPQLVSQRRELHQWPEPGWTEFTTTYYLVKKLKEWGYDVLLGTKVVKPDAVLGRSEKDVEAGLQAARDHHVPEEWYICYWKSAGSCLCGNAQTIFADGYK